jgi:AcrR family transcriptional regulator
LNTEQYHGVPQHFNQPPGRPNRSGEPDTFSSGALVTDLPRPPRQRRLPRAETRARLLAAAAHVFAQRGFSEATLEDVAETAGFSKGAVYSNFKGKDELFYALMTDRINERVRSATEGIAQHTAAGAQAAEVGRRITEKLAEQPDWHMLFIEFWARAVRDPQLREEFARHRRPVRAPIAELIQNAAADLNVELPVPAEQLAIAVLALSNGLAIEALADPESVPPELFGTILNLMLGALAHTQPPDAKEQPAPTGRAPKPSARRSRGSASA